MTQPSAAPHPAGLLDASDESAALETLHELGCTDGLPVVIPTPERVARYVLASGLEADLELGVMGPAGGSATVEKISVAAVMAGCEPDVMPLVIATVRAVLDPAFDLHEMQSTTHCTAPFVITSGPATELFGVASGFGALGPGHRANATVGRALRLAMINIGGGRPGTSDMALLGHPGKFTFCLGQAPDDPLGPLPTALGFEVGDSVVTVVGAEPPHSVIFFASGKAEEDAERLLLTLAASLTHPGSNNTILRGGAAVIVLNPDHADLLVEVGLDRQSIAESLVELTTFRREELEPWLPGLRGRDEVSRMAAFNDPSELVIFTAGGRGLYSVVLPTWCAGPHQNRAVSVAFDPAPSCEIPTAG